MFVPRHSDQYCIGVGRCSDLGGGGGGGGGDIFLKQKKCDFLEEQCL